MDIHTLQTTVRDFAAVRGWPRWHTPKNLAMALIVEAAELLEIFQWMTPEESAAAASDPAEKQRIGEEIADVQIYLPQMAHQTRIDVAAAVLDKLQRNARRYPAPQGTVDVTVGVDLPALPVLPTADPPVTHVLVDYENVQPIESYVPGDWLTALMKAISTDVRPLRVGNDPWRQTGAVAGRHEPQSDMVGRHQRTATTAALHAAAIRARARCSAKWQLVGGQREYARRR